MQLHNIVHLNIPDFYAAMEEIRRPELKKRPLVLAEPGERSVTQGVNRIARGKGISISLARKMCRRMTAHPIGPLPLPGKTPEYHGRNGAVFAACGRNLAGIVFSRHYGYKRLWGPEPDIACRIEKELAVKTGLHARIGLASNKLVSRVAANCIRPGDLSFIFPGNEKSFLAPLPMTLLPGLGEVTASRLAGFNIRTIGQIASFSFPMLAEVFGKLADRLLKAAKGIDFSPTFSSAHSRSQDHPGILGSLDAGTSANPFRMDKDVARNECGLQKPWISFA